MSDLDEIIQKLVKFRDDREWSQFHNSKDLSLALSVEASELLELFLWKDNEDFDKSKLKDELADVLCYAFLLANKNNLNIIEIVNDKIIKNGLKYPVNKAKGTSKKYNEL
jgi:NTP pyrophosphatase (non-canonical NTP hydrolase)